MKKPPRLYFSLRSPYSWMTVRQLQERLPGAAELIEFMPFFEPGANTVAKLQEEGGEFHYSPMSKAKHLYILADTKRLAGKFGYAMKWPVDIDPDWELPHLAWFKARELGVAQEYYAAVTAARWERGENICEPELLHRICTEAGLDGDALVAAPGEPHIQELGVAALMDMYYDDVFGVPYFRLGRHRFWGIDRLDDFLAELETAMAKG